ncbi:MAG: DUF5722 domain-containing protein [Planctomycetota bacterium]
MLSKSSSSTRRDSDASSTFGPPSDVKRDDVLLIVRFLQITLILALASFADYAIAADPTILWSTNGGVYDGVNDLSITRDASARETIFRTRGNDPYVLFDLVGSHVKQISRDDVLEFQYFCPDGVDGLQVRFGPPFSQVAIDLPGLPAAEAWTRESFRLADLPDEMSRRLRNEMTNRIRIDFGRRNDITLRIRSITIRHANAVELAEQQQEKQWRQRLQKSADTITQYYQQSFTCRIDSVVAQTKSVKVTGIIPNATSHDSKTTFLLRRFGPTVGASGHQEETAVPITPDRDGRFDLNIPRTIDDHVSGIRFQIFASDGTQAFPVSHAHYVSDFDYENRETFSPLPNLHAAKGLTCVSNRWTADDLKPLGLKHGTVNVLLAELLCSQPGPGLQPTLIHGTQWYVDERRLIGLDKRVMTAVDAGMRVACTLLVQNQQQTQGATQLSALLRHPSADPAGVYAMPNLIDEDSAQRYVATLSLLADRYGDPKNPRRRVDHWIVHNEVDYGWQWTNMGRQPLPTYMQHYYASMRIVDAAVRSRNPHARVFISLTHRWNVPDDRPWKTYSPRDMLHWLVRACQVEGDFPWGIAYHPYPQSLWKSDTWNDTSVNDSFDTPLITIKNLQVLDRFVHSQEMLTRDGKLRPVILSEQGFHAPAGDTDALKRQQQALLYTFDKIRQLPSILAFDYHRPSDHPNEGGLMLGLRGLPNEQHRLGRPKPAWQLYHAIDTPAEDEWRDSIAVPSLE